MFPDLQKEYDDGALGVGGSVPLGSRQPAQSSLIHAHGSFMQYELPDSLCYTDTWSGQPIFCAAHPTQTPTASTRAREYGAHT